MKLSQTLPIVLLAYLLLGTAPSLPKLYVIGDSISMRYGPFLEKYVQGVWQYDRKSDDGQAAKNLDVPVGANGGDSRMVLEYLKLKAPDKTFQPDVLLLNCGLHDIKRNPETNAIQVDSASYRKNLEAIYQLLHKRNIRLVWMRTTSVEDERHNTRSKAFKRYARDLDAYNAIADEVMHKHGVSIVDLYTFTRSLGSEHFVDHVHYDDAAMQLQAGYIAGFLQGLLPLTQKRK
ncbi:SGNH/GDSL hydrolase family protein [Spirosoma validum]|uniref:SGNH/GDSL hydrolase family protein n=1 Tax=Spirosoma validum TaxID=2771355 RepID=A0A927GE36_9BACT|nr:SGNH/GDSL hydrolase family protein [Spirosoma validum]MBD2754359.1 SGNH/GDSL hydrolase family protein [Spirosoma validum]